MVQQNGCQHEIVDNLDKIELQPSYTVNYMPYRSLEEFVTLRNFLEARMCFKLNTIFK